jgi:hypothetical protein
MESVLEVATIVWSCNNNKCTWIFGSWFVPGCLELYQEQRSWIVLGIVAIKSVLGVVAERYCSHCEELQLWYYSHVAILVHESSKFL